MSSRVVTWARQSGVLLGRLGERFELSSGQDAEGDLQPHHLGIGLTLAVDALKAPKPDEGGGVPLSVAKSGDLGVEVGNLGFTRGE